MSDMCFKGMCHECHVRFNCVEYSDKIKGMSICIGCEYEDDCEDRSDYIEGCGDYVKKEVRND